MEKVHELLEDLSDAIRETKYEQTGVRAEQKMFGQLENITLGENASVVINQNMVLTVNVEKRVQAALIATKELMQIFPSNDRSLDEIVLEYKKVVVWDALKNAEWHIDKAAKALGLTHRTVRYFISKNCREAWKNRPTKQQIA